MRLFGRFYVSIDGVLEGQNDTLELKYVGDPVPIPTTVEDLAGFMIPTKHAVLTLKNFIPVSGQSVDYVRLYLTNKFVNVQISDDAGNRRTAQGMVNGPTLSSAPNDPSRMDVSITLQTPT